MTMRTLDYAQYSALREGAHVIEADGSGDKVLRLTDGSFLKLFRRKRLISSALWYPYAQRFADNCQALTERNILCPRVRDVFRITGIARDAVHYAPLPGHTLRQLLEEAEQADHLRAQFGEFLAKLHEQGIYFRSAHLGNIVLTPEGELGLIDVADLHVRKTALQRSLRLRNFKHMLRYEKDRKWLLNQDGRFFIGSYLANQSVCNARELAAVLR